METLAQITNKERFSREDKESSTKNFVAYTTLFAVNVASRYPDLSLDQIPVDEVVRIAEFSKACTPILLKTWNKSYEEKDIRRAA